MLFCQLWSQEEYSLLTQLAPLPGQAHLPATYAALLTPLTTLFNTTLSSLSTLIKRSLHKYTFHALASYAALSTCQDRWDDLITRRAERKENELKEGLHALRGVCLRSFPEFLADLKLAGMGKGGEIGTGCADFTITVRPSHSLVSPKLVSFVPIQTTRYLEQLVEVRDAVGPALMLLGDGNWKMGDGVQAKPNKGKPAPGSESVLIAHYACELNYSPFDSALVSHFNHRRCCNDLVGQPHVACTDAEASGFWFCLLTEQHVLSLCKTFTTAVTSVGNRLAADARRDQLELPDRQSGLL